MRSRGAGDHLPGRLPSATARNRSGSSRPGSQPATFARLAVFAALMIAAGAAGYLHRRRPTGLRACVAAPSHYLFLCKIPPGGLTSGPLGKAFEAPRLRRGFFFVGSICRRDAEPVKARLPQFEVEAVPCDERAARSALSWQTPSKGAEMSPRNWDRVRLLS
jgi:hypothetical protein